MARMIIYEDTSYSFDLTGLFILFFSVVIMFLFSLLILRKDMEIIEIIFFILLYLLIFFHIKRINDCIVYFLPIEMYTINSEILCYEKKLLIFYKFLIIKKFQFSIFEIDKISDVGIRKIKNAIGMGANPLWYLFYFKPHPRILIELKNKEKIYVWNYVKRTAYRDFFADNRESEKEFKEMFENLKSFIENAKKDYEFEKRKEEIYLIYELSIEERYPKILERVVKEEKIYIAEINGRTIINGDTLAIKNLDVFKNMNFKEVDFYIFYINYLSRKERADECVEVAYNGVDSKKVKISQLKEDINIIRYPDDYKN